MRSNKTLLAVIMMTGTLTAAAQSNINSPYTRFGLGELSPQSFTDNSAMGGIGYALRSNSRINLMNPASFSAVDSLSFMFDVGMSLKSSNFEENGIRNNAKNASFDNFAMQFRLHPRLGIAIAFSPYSSIGYNFSETRDQSSDTYYGDGGLQKITAGLGFKVFKNLSVGAQAGYLYGSIDYQTSTLTNGTNSDYTIKYQNMKFKSYVADFGLQYTQPISKTDNVTVGLSYGLGHTLNVTNTEGTQVTDNSSYSSTKENETKDGFGIPHTFGAGVVYSHGQNWLIGADYSLQKWGSVKYNHQDGMYKDMSKVAVGAEYTPNSLAKSYLKRMHYRVGAHYNNSYLKFTSGSAKEYGVSAGLAFPLYLYQRNTVLNITGEYVRVKPSTSAMLSENRFVLKLGLTFIEHWFMKWKVN